MTVHIESVYLALIAYVYSGLLTESGMIFNGLYRYLARTLPDWLFSPIIGCYKCVAGQFALWFYLVYFWSEYNFFEHILFISATILSAVIINKIITYNEQTY